MHSDLEQIYSDAVLHPDLTPEPARPMAASNDALITGATGFLGRYVVARLLQETGRRLFLVVRPKNGQAAVNRVTAVLAEIGVHLPDFSDRVTVLEGDVTHDRFGLEPDIYRDCALRVDAIYHCSATVDWVRDYGRLRQVNVEGVRRMIQFACTARKKRIIFSSSIAVCMFRESVGEMTEYSPVLAHVAKMPLGYARSKAVAETLLAQCAERGVPVTIIRPPLISGHSRTGQSNPTDIFAALLQTCIMTGKGPDTDWTFDIAPVDFVAKVFTDVPQGADPWQVLNLKQPNSRHWGNLLTWINLHGYRVDRVPTQDWIEHLFANGAARGLMLYTQRQYFAGRPPRAGETGWVRPFEAYLSASYSFVLCSKTSTILNDLGIVVPDVDVDLLHAYFRDLRQAKVLPARREGVRPDQLEKPLGPVFFGYNAQRIGKESGIMNQLAASLAQESAGLWVLNSGARGVSDQKVIKLKPHGSILRDQSIVLATLASPELGKLFKTFGDPFELVQSGDRERAIYSHTPDGLARYMPKVLDAEPGLVPGQHCLVLEYLPDTAQNEPASWISSSDPDFQNVLQGMSSIHALGFGRAIDIDARIKPVMTPSIKKMVELLPLWNELANVSRPKFHRFAGENAVAQHIHCIQSLADWWPQYEKLPKTIIHNDFNPRNFVLRKEFDPPLLCAYDWEIVAIGPPQRDLAELLCFSWTPGAGREHLEGLLEKTRHILEIEAVCSIANDSWSRGFRLALKYFLISRLPLYVLVEELSTLPFLPRVIANCMELLALTKEYEDASYM
jgi:thioester reductase-like protein